MYLIFTIVVLLLISYLFVIFMKFVKIPSVVALIISGIVLGFSGLNKTLIGDNTDIIFLLGDIALIALMFLAGLEGSWQVIYKERKEASFIALFASFFPFVLGFIFFLLLGYSTLMALIIGLCMAITAEATKAKILFELKKIKSRVGSTMIGAGIIDDVFGLLIFIFITFIFKTTDYREQVLIILAIASFFIGLVVQEYAREHHITKKLEFGFNYFLVPFFFISMGMHFDVASLILNPYILLLVIGIAIAGKLFGTLLAKPFVNFSWQQLYLIGWGMNSRGAVELAIAIIAFRGGLITNEIYSSLVIMALCTTLIFPFIIVNKIKTNKNIMD